MNNKKTVLISGASSGIGAACAKLFAENGYRLILAARNYSRLENLGSELKKSIKGFEDIVIYKLDVRDREAVMSMINELPHDFRKIDILINNAGLALGRNKFFEGEVDDWEVMIDTNLKGVLYLTRAVLPKMIKENTGHIINIGSIAGRENYIGGNVYCATKAAIRSLNDSLKKDLTGTNIRVSSVDPGMVETNFSSVRFNGDNDKASEVYKGMTPLVAKDIADIVYFCASRPHHVNISEVFVLPTDQSGATLVSRREE
jgi:3-hydroxy acid dehydrogenase / malonic semialdehyde reductase